MATATLVDLVKIQVLSSGTGSFELGPAVPGFRGIEALSNGSTYHYSVQNGARYEIGAGVFVSTPGLLTRLPRLSTNGNAAVPFSANIELSFTALAEDYGGPGIPLADELGPSTTSAITQNAVTQALIALLAGEMAWNLPDEANGDPIPAPGSRLPYLSAGVFKIA